jgi:RNA polymerase sigma factor (TIGR02999 family)
MTGRTEELARLVDAWSEGDQAALDRLIDLVYDDLRALAHGRLGNERGDHTLSTTALVHEVYLQLAGTQGPEWRGRGPFFALLSRIMRNVLVDYARTRVAAKRGGGLVRVALRDDRVADQDVVEILAMHEALSRLAGKDERLARLVECRFFGGLNDAEIADALGVSERTVNRDWKRARAYLFRLLAVESGDAG